MENNHRKFGDTTGKQKQYVSDEKSTSSGKEKGDQMRRRMNIKLKMMIMIALVEELSNEASSKTKNIQKSSTPPSKRQLTVMETLQKNKMKRE